jgi:hypothetical protein
MRNEPPIASRAEAERVRKQIAATGEKALELLAEELGTKGLQENSRGEPVFIPLDEEWVRNFKHVADQLRRDFRLDVEDLSPEVPAEQPTAPAEPLKRLRIVRGPKAS